jgi:4'-phosphopantetheinyl transferase EntD
MGLDLEPAEPLPTDVTALVVRPSERANAGALRATDIDPRLYGTVLFTAKEALVKCMSPLCDALFELRDFEIDLRPVDKTFVARYHGSGPDRCKRLAAIGSGTFVAGDGFVLALYWLPPPTGCREASVVTSP